MIRRRPLAVVALGDSALLRRGGSGNARGEAANIAMAARSLAELSRTHRLVVLDGNGPHERQGPLGHLLDRHLASVVHASRVVTLVPQVVVDPSDPACAAPGTPVPREVVELETIRLLVEAGLLVVCAGGGGIPVVASAGGLEAVDRVVDKDATAALLAADLGAELLILLTDVAGVYQDWGTDEARLITRTSPAELAERPFATESMAPKVTAACRFVERTGRAAVIAAVDDAADAAAGHAGTWVLPDEPMGRRAA
jgi:carbamate kinase